MKNNLLLFIKFGLCLLLVTGCFSTTNAQCDKPLKVGFKYWHETTVFSYKWKAVVFTTIIETFETNSDNGLEDMGGHLEINEILYSSPTKKDTLKKMSCITTEGLRSSKTGDRLALFLIEYEESYALPRLIGSNNIIGIELTKKNEKQLNKAVTTFYKKEQTKAEHLENKKFKAFWSEYDANLKEN